MNAALWGYLDMVNRLLYERDAGTSLANLNGHTAAMLAKQFIHPEIEKKILEHDQEKLAPSSLRL